MPSDLVRNIGCVLKKGGENPVDSVVISLGHTFPLMYISIKAGRGWSLFASDCDFDDRLLNTKLSVQPNEQTASSFHLRLEHYLYITWKSAEYAKAVHNK